VDPRKGTTNGVLRLSPAPGEAPVDHYDLAFTDGAARRQPFRALLGQTTPVDMALLPGTVVPAGLEYFEIRAVRAGVTSPPLRLRADNYPRVVDIAGNSGVDRLSRPELHVDAVKQRTIFVAVDPSAKATARICNINGAGCYERAVDAGLGKNSSASWGIDSPYTREAHSVFDAVARRLYIATQSSASGNPGLRVVTCDVDTWVCGHRLVKATTGTEVHPVIDAPGKRLLLFETGGRFGFEQSRSVWTCGLDPSVSCSLVAQLPAGVADAIAGYGRTPYIAGAGGAKLYGVFGTSYNPGASQVLVLDCTLADFSCTTRTLPGVPMVAPSLFAASAAGRIGLIGTGATGAIVAYDCDDGLSACESKTLLGPQNLSNVAVVGASADTFTAADASKLFRCSWSSGMCTPMPSPLPMLRTECAGVLPSRLRLCGADQSGGLITANCELDGTACVISQVADDALRTDGADSTFSLLDEPAGRLLTLATNPSRNLQPSLIVCDALGANCEHRDLSAGDSVDQFYDPQMALADASGPLVMSVRENSTGRGRLFVCGRDGRNCTHRDLVLGLDERVWSTSLRIDPANKKILLVSLSPQEAHLIRCNLDGNACSHTLLGRWDMGDGFGAQLPLVRVLASTGQLLIGSPTQLLLCPLDGASCSARPLPIASDSSAMVAEVAEVSGSYLVWRTSYSSKPSSLEECPFTGAPCVSRLLSGLPSVYANWHAARLDVARQVLYLAEARDSTLSLHRCTRSGVDWGCSELTVQPSQFVSPLLGRYPRYSLDLNEADRQLVVSFAGPTRRPQVILLDRF